MRHRLILSAECTSHILASGERYLDDCNIKVLKYNNDYAKVYAVFENDLNEVGLLYYFTKSDDGNWIYDYYDAVYSKTGSADGFI